MPPSNVQWLAKRTSKPYRLPSEAEWEYAAHAGTSARYSWGDQVGVGKASCNGCGGPRDSLHPPAIATYAPNPWGLHDMHGGVAEWVEDCWHSNYQGTPTDGSAWHTPSCPKHVLRGGSWNNPPADITSSSRNFYDANVRYLANGVRVALLCTDRAIRRAPPKWAFRSRIEPESTTRITAGEAG